jgi:probable F420-dependent oxidoreductase
MKFDAALPPVPLSSIAEIARAAEKLGFQGLWSSETIHDPFLPGAIIAEHTQHIQFGTSVAVSFARSPATLAYTAWDLAQASDGRFILGLGTQVKAHIERRFGMAWPDSVVTKLREQVTAIRTFWKCWQTGERLRFDGAFYKLNLMTPFFNPGPIYHPDIPIYLSGVNVGLAHLAGEVADGFLVHPLHTPTYLAEILFPAIERGAQKARRSRADVSISATAFVITSPEEEAFVRAQVAFYASTPSYRAVMKLHGWEQAAEQLSVLASHSQWGAMPEIISKNMLETFATYASPTELGRKLSEKYRGLADRLTLYLPYQPGQKDAFWERLIAEIN